LILLAVFEKSTVQSSSVFDDFVVVLVSTRNPLNLGAAARAMQNFGFPHLSAVNPWEGAWKGARSAVGADEILHSAQEYTSLAEAIADCSLVVGVTGMEYRFPVQPILAMAQAAPKLREHATTQGHVALVFGSEKSGLTNEELDLCHLLVTIPTRPEQESMNLGQAVAVCLYEIARDAMPLATSTAPRPARGADLTLLEELLLPIMDASKPIPPRHMAVTRQRIEQLLRRLNLSEKDAQTLLGTLRHITHRLGLS
jgi:tRNA/rRNA methyltransferase